MGGERDASKEPPYRVMSWLGHLLWEQEPDEPAVQALPDTTEGGES